MSLKGAAAGPSPTSSGAKQHPTIGLPSAQIPEEAPKGGDTSWSLWTWARRMQSAALLAATLACALVACLGAGLLAFLFVARTFAPATAHIIQPLYFDYTRIEATASVSLLNTHRSTYYAHSLHEINHKNVSIPHSKERFLAPGEQITLWVELELPELVQPEIFQAVGELRTADGIIAAKSSRPVLPKPRPLLARLVRIFTVGPLVAVGLWHDNTKMQVTLFERYREQEDTPFAIFVCKLHGRAGGGLPPPVAKAWIHIRLHLGMIRRLLYWVRPNGWVTLWLVLVGLTALLGGASFSTLFAVLWLCSLSSGGASRRSAPDGRPGDEDELSSESSADGFSADLSPDSDEESPLAGDPPEADFDEAEADLNFSLLSPRDAAAKRFAPPRRRGSSLDATSAAGGGDVVATAGSTPASPVRQRRGIGGMLGLSSPARRR